MKVRRKCPFCLGVMGSAGSRENVSVNLSRGSYHCWRCGTWGKLNKWAARKLDIDESYVVKGGYSSLPDEDEDEQELEKPPGFTPLYPREEVVDSVVLRPYVRYLRKRKVSFKLAELFEIGVVLDPPRDFWYTAGNIVYPVQDGDHPGYIRRHIRRQGYYNSPGLALEEGWFYNGRALSNLDQVYVVEGPHDVLGMKGRAVAGLTKDITDAQLDRLANTECDIIFAMDGDAWRSSMSLARRLTLRGKTNAGWVKLPPGRDPDDLGYSSVVKLPILDYIK